MSSAMPTDQTTNKVRKQPAVFTLIRYPAFA